MSELILTTFDWVPEMPRGYVRDIRARWALEEAGLKIVERVSIEVDSGENAQAYLRTKKEKLGHLLKLH